jgi:hypothetical protein
MRLDKGLRQEIARDQAGSAEYAVARPKGGYTMAPQMRVALGLIALA